MIRLIFLALLPLVLAAAPPQESPIGEASKYTILYAGRPDDEREGKFLKLLKAHFAKVDSIRLSDLTPEKAGPYDVVIADWSRRYKNGQFAGGSGSNLSINASFSKPVVMIGAVGGEIQRHTKLDWL